MGEPYWTVSQGKAIRTGWSCRECHQGEFISPRLIIKLEKKLVIYRGEEISVRDGRKMRFFYHTKCYSGVPDPRSQPGGSFMSNEWRPGKDISLEAPVWKGRGKWSVQQYGYAHGTLDPKRRKHGRDETDKGDTLEQELPPKAAKQIIWGFERRERTDDRKS